MHRGDPTTTLERGLNITFRLGTEQVSCPTATFSLVPKQGLVPRDGEKTRALK